MLCVTGGESSLSGLVQRLNRYKDAGLQEIRLDLLKEPGELVHQLDLRDKRCILTCRTSREGGGFEGSESERVSLLAATLELHPAWMDIELSTPSDFRNDLMTRAKKKGVRVLLSHHRLETGQTHLCGQLLADLARNHPDGIKLAVSIRDAAELEDLIAAGQDPAMQNTVRVLLGMGAAGLLSRAMYPRFGSTWSYAASSPDNQTAPGQLTVDDYRLMRLPPQSGSDLYVLIGAMQVMQSPGPRVYNRLFSKLGIPAVYLPVVTERALPTLQMLMRFGLRGASVTMPLKNQLVPHLVNLGKEARDTGVINTVTCDPRGGLSGGLTDGLGAKAALEKCLGNLEGKKAVVLGSGATATAVAHGLFSSGVQVCVVGRSIEKARRVAEIIPCQSASLDELAAIDFDILVNATPVGADNPSHTLVSNPKMLAGKTVLDVVLGTETRLLRDAQKWAAHAIPGRSMWAEQGRLQLWRWLGVQVDASELESDP